MSEPVRLPILDLQPQIQAHWEAYNEAFQRVLRSGQFILGPEEQAFEAECAAFLGVRHAIGLNSGTDALYIALRALRWPDAFPSGDVALQKALAPEGQRLTARAAESRLRNDAPHRESAR